MRTQQPWLLPEGIDELLPAEAAQLEALRRRVIDCLTSWGYQLVFPPLVEHLDALLTGAGQSLDLQTFKLTDQMSGRMLGVRADITPQVARIAAHQLRDEPISRLCYIGSVLHTKPQNMGDSRNPIQLGAEIFGHAGTESDIEILQLMMAVLSISDAAEDVFIDLGHVGLYRGLAVQAGLTTVQEEVLFAALQRKSLPDIQTLLAEYAVDEIVGTMILALADLNGDVSVLDTAEQVLVAGSDAVKAALATVREMVALVAARLPNVPLHIDLAELRGYHYHTGLVFAAYRSGSAQAVALGGRYDDVGSVFGTAQPATGFSLDLKQLSAGQAAVDTQEMISVAWCDAPAQAEAIAALRKQGERVYYHLPNTENTARRSLVKQADAWVVTETGQ